MQKPGLETVTVVAATVAVLIIELMMVSSVTAAGTDVLMGITVTVTVLVLAAHVEFVLPRAPVSLLQDVEAKAGMTIERVEDSQTSRGGLPYGTADPRLPGPAGLRLDAS